MTPNAAEVERIAAISNPVIRNLQITQCYSLLAAEIASRSGEGANWCTYATWASRQAGRTIRGEDLRARFESKLKHGRWMLHPMATMWRRLLRHGLFSPETRMGRVTASLHTPFDAFERASAAVARGNLKVFEEIGLEFARYLEESPDFIDGLRPGEPPEGQRYLRQAFARYERLRVEQDPKARVELAVLANLEVGLHEQTRLQPEIREAIDAAYATQEDLGRRTLKALIPSAESWWSVFRRPAAAAARVVGAGAQRSASRLAREVITESLMVLSLPGRVLALGTHLTDAYPEALREPANVELTELLARFEPVPPARDDCGARDWSDLQQRMHYIVHMFCAFHLNKQLASPPFAPEQVESFEQGIVPDGEL